MKLHKHLLTLLTFSLITTVSFGVTFYIDGEVLNTNGASIPVEYSTDNFKTSTTVYTTSSGTTIGIFRDTVTLSSSSVTFVFRLYTCDRTLYVDSITINPSSSTTLKPSLNYCPRLNRKCAASFSASVNDSIVTFTNSSTGLTSTSTFTWDFGDGSSSTSKSPVHTYSKDSTYPVCLIISDTATSCADTFCSGVTTGSNSSPCVAKFSVRKDSNNKYGIVIINQSKATGTVNYLWDFGDGNSSTQKNPTHTYKTFGKFYLCLTIYASGTNCRSAFCDSIGLDSSGKMLKAGFSIIVVDETLSAPNAEKPEIRIFPNPVSDELNLDIPEGITVNGVSILDLKGVHVFHTDQSNPDAINVSSLSNGIYFLQIDTDFGVINRKFSKQ